MSAVETLNGTNTFIQSSRVFRFQQSVHIQVTYEAYEAFNLHENMTD